MKRLITSLLLAGLVRSAAAAEPALQLIEVRRADCVACALMREQLQADARWTALATSMAVRTVDADQAEAAAFLRQHTVGRLPAWLLLNADGAELGRVAGAVDADRFHARIDVLAAARSSLLSRRQRARETTPQGAAATAEALAQFHAEGRGDAGFAWWLSLPISVRGQHSAAPEVQRWRNRIELLQAAELGQAAAADIAGRKVLADPLLGCDRGLEVDRYRRAIAALPAASRRAALLAQAPALAAEVRHGWQAEPPACIDGLSLVRALADLQAELGDATRERVTLSDALAILDRRIAASPSAALRNQRGLLATRLSELSTSGAAR